MGCGTDKKKMPQGGLFYSKEGYQAQLKLLALFVRAVCVVLCNSRVETSRFVARYCIKFFKKIQCVVKNLKSMVADTFVECFVEC
jgi:hypothetical protein